MPRAFRHLVSLRVSTRHTTLVVEINEDFSETVYKKGFTRAFSRIRHIDNVLSGGSLVRSPG